MKKAILFLVGTFFVLGMSSVVRAEDSAAEGLVSNINIYDAQVIEQNGRDIKIIFDIINEGGTVNGDTVVPQVKYAVNLLKGQKDEEGSLTFSASVDTFAYAEVLSVNAGEKIHKEIVYTVPDSIDGEFYINLDSKNEQGLPLTTVVITSPITMARAEGALEIIADSCVMKVAGEEEIYSTYKGVDVDSDEQLSLECDVQNYSTQPVTFIPQMTIFDRSVFGKQLSQNDLNQEILDSQERKKIQFTISLPEAPQSYDAQLVLNAENKLSNRVGGHFVVRGNSATIQDVQLDRDYYAKGETAEMVIALDGRVDMFLGSRAFGDEFPEDQDDASLYVDIHISGDNGECVVLTGQKYADSGFGYMKQSITMQEDCKNPQIKITAKDAKGNILRESTFNITTKEDKKAVTAKRVDFSWIAIGVVAILSLIMLVIIVMKRKGVLKLFLFTLVLSGGLLWNSGTSVEAATYNVPASTTVAEQQAGTQRYTTLTVNNNKASYPTTDTQMTLTFQGTIRSCGNGTWGFTVFNGYVKGASTITASNPLYYVGGANALVNELAKAMPVMTKVINIPNKTVGIHNIAMTGVNWRYYANNQYNTETSTWCGDSTPPIYSYPSQFCEYDFNADASIWTKNNTSICLRSVAADSTPCADLDYAWADPLQFAHPYTMVAVVNGDCAVTHNNCVAGSLGGTAIYADSYQWWCNGLNGGSNELCTEWKINGVCAATHNNCAAGVLGGTAEYSNSYQWWCNSPNGGSNNLCTELKVNGVCGNAQGSYLVDATAWRTPSCATPTQAALGAFLAKGETKNWLCVSSNGGTPASCSATRASDPVDGACGNAQGPYLADATDWRTPSCATPTQAVLGTFLIQGETKNWSCVGSSGGTTAPCSATRALPVTCGSANGTIVTSQPTSSLCSGGSAVWVDEEASDGTYNWTCDVNSCSASFRNLNWTEESPN